ncbi:MAG: hypothetical protein CME33_17715 [Gimesia sp.]|uniref:DUF4011 domain-containing protein n=1 Tax=Gimesia sp. TaxID=2024833 RepID=UPI000C484131|nr:DUF4011 domain-containing protein [Gimesia sp.]MAX38395.1 hypothetical protein [Gimesia sp.]|tara:strand:- start:20369 stop:25873 length:5505 start_codon:yes stop_codon:yes gene_type:complete
MSSTSNDQESVLSSLEASRKKLLDMSKRNKLLKFDLESKRSKKMVRIIDYPLSLLAECLVDIEKKYFFEPIDEPDEREYLQIKDSEGNNFKKKPDPEAWAKHLGINTSFNLPLTSGDEQPKYLLKSLHYPSELEKILHGISKDQINGIQEKGVNSLYLACGFLKYYESESSDLAMYAPLYLIPITLTRDTLDKKTQTYKYSLTWTNDDIHSNVSLQEKIRLEFNLQIPDTDEMSAKEYIEAIAGLLGQHSKNPVLKRWEVINCATLAFFDFTRIAMYQDLDPSRWPANSPIQEHPIIQRFFSSSELEEGIVGFQSEHNIDQIKDIHEKFPLIDDADSSQHSALVDVLDRKNLVIEGPPGTGKSQTITNIIAAALSQGQKVLFVSAKQAALDVVLNRLNRAGLGSFCLALHTNNLQKGEIHKSIKQRLDENFRRPTELNSDISRLEDHKAKLLEYAEVINTNWKSTELTPHKILSKATYLRVKLNVDPESLHPKGHDGSVLTPQNRNAIIDAAHEIVIHYQELKNEMGDSKPLYEHPWYGVKRTKIIPKDARLILSFLEEHNSNLIQLKTIADEFEQYLGTELGNISSYFLAEQAHVELRSLPSDIDDELLSVAKEMTTERIKVLGRYIELNSKMKEKLNQLSVKLKHRDNSHHEYIKKFERLIENLLEIGIEKGTSLSELDSTGQLVTQVYDELHILLEPLIQVKDQLGDKSNNFLEPSMNGLKEIKELINAAYKLPSDLWDWRDPSMEGIEANKLIPEIKVIIYDLSKKKEALKQYFNVENHLSIKELSDLRLYFLENHNKKFKWLSTSWWKHKKQLKQISSRSCDVSILYKKIKYLIEFKKENESFESNERYRRLLGKHFNGLETPIEKIEHLKNWYFEIRQRYGKSLGARKIFGDLIISLPCETLELLVSLKSDGYEERVDQLINGIEGIKKTFPKIGGMRESSMLLENDKSVFEDLLKILNRYYKNHDECFGNKNLTISQVMDELEAWYELQELENNFIELENDNLWIDESIKLSDIDQIEQGYQLLRCQTLYGFSDYIFNSIKTSGLYEKITSSETSEVFQELSVFQSKLELSIEHVDKSLCQFIEATDLDQEDWETTCTDDLTQQIKRNEFALEKKEWLNSGVDLQRNLQTLQDYGFEQVVNQIAKGIIVPEKVVDSVELGIYDYLANEIFQENKVIALFAGKRQLGIQSNFRRYDESLKLLQRDEIACLAAQREVPPGNGGGKVSTYSDLALIRHECLTKTKRHIPIRQLIERSAKALVALKPCFMMSPLAVSQYLRPGIVNFDMIVIDEASQLRPEEALGAIARGKQFVIVGDPKQLPPTDTFMTTYDDEDDDRDTITDSESILDASISLFQTRRLRWHYRSQHESLVAFSNKAFYDNDLVVFPSPHKNNDEYGLKFNYLPEGKYSSGMNHHEAQIIATAIKDHLINRSEESLGVVAMNRKQADLIEDYVERLTKEDSQFSMFFEKDRQKTEPLFIKNLENVQGDERDVIMISCTYGPDKDVGRVFQRFGDINKDGGWRRLNVLFTRSKKRMLVFSSLESHDILISESTNLSIKAFKDFLAYAKSGVVEQPVYSGRKDGSDFQIAVKDALRKRGYECESEVGVAGFFIDLAVIDPKSPGRFLIGIECDGATYHSAKSVRDRDRLRQIILERLGWTIRRIWSPDWFKNPDAEIDTIVNALEYQQKQLSKLDSKSTQKEIDEILSTSRLQNIQESKAHEPDSDFEEDVIQLLSEKGIECDSQVEVGQYRIDIAIRNPYNSGQYLLGIECDGASYHSSYLKRAEDRVRQDALEKSGWIIHRIWSTDWFENPRKEIEKIEDKIDQMINQN